MPSFRLNRTKSKPETSTHSKKPFIALSDLTKPQSSSWLAKGEGEGPPQNERDPLLGKNKRISLGFLKENQYWSLRQRHPLAKRKHPSYPRSVSWSLSPHEGSFKSKRPSFCGSFNNNNTEEEKQQPSTSTSPQPVQQRIGSVIYRKSASPLPNRIGDQKPPSPQPCRIAPPPPRRPSPLVLQSRQHSLLVPNGGPSATSPLISEPFWPSRHPSYVPSASPLISSIYPRPSVPWLGGPYSQFNRGHYLGNPFRVS